MKLDNEYISKSKANKLAQVCVTAVRYISSFVSSKRGPRSYNNVVVRWTEYCKWSNFINISLSNMILVLKCL